eukprot:gnl/TRDRNA2_/TRDRNA2_185965_c0_seq1.p1 gnl/TRDRNA2_/TRDRNA2_185965_c0~~gnl/TRDRNA2_/TRDRNA2_185965_c0_seq1.p1  ORF type:complete len:312 (+),score=55.88 gnl/TRDRNA2_/TRDRNA2_185965_c0_seq1:61-996(+)
MPVPRWRCVLTATLIAQACVHASATANGCESIDEMSMLQVRPASAAKKPQFDEDFELLQSNEGATRSNETDDDTWPVIKPFPSRTGRDVEPFPPYFHKRPIVANHSLTFKLPGEIVFHPFDLALYLEKNSTLWGRAPNPGAKDVIMNFALSNSEEIVQHVPSATIVLKTVQEFPKLLPARMITGYLREAMLPFLSDVPTANEAGLDKFLNLVVTGKEASRNTLMAFSFGDNGLQVDVSGQRFNFDNPDFVAMAKDIFSKAIEVVMGEDSPVRKDLLLMFGAPVKDSQAIRPELTLEVADHPQGAAIGESNW